MRGRGVADRRWRMNRRKELDDRATRRPAGVVACIRVTSPRGVRVGRGGESKPEREVGVDSQAPGRSKGLQRQRAPEQHDSYRNVLTTSHSSVNELERKGDRDETVCLSA